MCIDISNDSVEQPKAPFHPLLLPVGHVLKLSKAVMGTASRGTVSCYLVAAVVSLLMSISTRWFQIFFVFTTTWGRFPI